MIEKIVLNNHIYYGKSYTIDLTQQDTLVIYDPTFTRFEMFATIVESVIRFLDTTQNKRASLNYLTFFLRETGTKLLNPHKTVELELYFSGAEKIIYRIGSRGGSIASESLEWDQQDGKRQIVDRQHNKTVRETESIIHGTDIGGKFVKLLNNIFFKNPSNLLPNDPSMAVDCMNNTLFLVNYFTKERVGCVEGMIEGKKEAIKDKRKTLSRTISKWIINTNVNYQQRNTTLLPAESQLLIQSTSCGGLQTVGC